MLLTDAHVTTAQAVSMTVHAANCCPYNNSTGSLYDYPCCCLTAHVTKEVTEQAIFMTVHAAV